MDSNEMRARLKEMIIDHTTIIISLDGKHYHLPLRQAWEVADELGITLKEMMEMDDPVTAESGG